MRVLLTAAALLCVGVPAGNAATTTHTIYNDDGGAVSTYVQRIMKFKRQGGTRVKIAGLCSSACLLWLHKDFGLEHCATRQARLGYHMPYAINDRGVIVTTPAVMKELNRIGKYVFDGLPATMKQEWASRHVPSVSDGDSKHDALWIRGMDAVRALGKCK